MSYAYTCIACFQQYQRNKWWWNKEEYLANDSDVFVDIFNSDVMVSFNNDLYIWLVYASIKPLHITCLEFT